MVAITHQANQPWSNYHLNQNATVVDAALVQDQAGAPTGLAGFADAAAALKTYLADCIKTPPADGTGLLGASWSLSPIIGMSARQLDTLGLDGLAWAQASDLHPKARGKAGEILLAGGGTRLFRLVPFAEASGRSIKTCGSYLGQSVAGALATGVNGSALGYGGYQNQMCGLHLVTAPDRSVWIEAASNPVLSDAAAAQIADQVIRDDGMFANCLVNLGGMGIVCGVAMETVEKHWFSVQRRRKQVDTQWAAWVEAGDFVKIAHWLGNPGPAVYYEVQIDPFDPFGTPALHTMYFRVAPPMAKGPAWKVHRLFDKIGSVIPDHQAAMAAADEGNLPDIKDLFDFYSANIFTETPQQSAVGAKTWGQLHETPPDHTRQGVVYTSAFAIDRHRFRHAVTAMNGAVVAELNSRPVDQRDRKHLLYTLRFVDHAAGTLAWTRFPHTIVVDMEGLAPWPFAEMSARATLHGLESDGIDYSMHWAKLLPPSGTKVAADFGPVSDPKSPIRRWQDTRMQLVPPEMRAWLRNRAMGDWGLG